MLNHSCPGAVLQEGQALQIGRLRVGVQTDHNSFLYVTFLECVLSPVLKHCCCPKSPVSSALICSGSAAADRAM